MKEYVTVPEELLKKGSRLLATARGVDELDALKEELSILHPGLKRGKARGDLSVRDFERLHLESEMVDLRSQLRALEDVPGYKPSYLLPNAQAVIVVGMRLLKGSLAKGRGRPVAWIKSSSPVISEPRPCTCSRSQPMSGAKSPRASAPGISGTARTPASKSWAAVMAPRV